MMTNVDDHSLPAGTAGLVIHNAAFYDLTVWLMTLGRERGFREKILQLVQIKPGQSVLDVGCGTGSLAIAAKRHVGSAGTIVAIDASPEMLARAAKKAGKAGSDIIFRQAAAQALPFPNGQFDTVLSTVMFHHLPRKGRRQCAREMGRVLKPGGRVLIVDFAAPERKKNGFFSHFHRHGHVALGDIVAVFEDAGLKILEGGALKFRNLQYALATIADMERPHHAAL